MTTRRTTKATAIPRVAAIPKAKKTLVSKPQTTEKNTVKPVARADEKKSAKKARKEHKVKIVRDSFTIPQNEYQKIAEIKEACLKSGLHVKKSEVLRAGLKALSGLTTAQLKQALGNLEKIKTGRPKKH